MSGFAKLRGLRMQKPPMLFGMAIVCNLWWTGCQSSSFAPGEDLLWFEQEVDFRRRVDLLLVVDDAPSMAPKRRALARGLGSLYEVFGEAWQPVDLRVAVVPTRAGVQIGEDSVCTPRIFTPRFLAAPGGCGSDALDGCFDFTASGCGRNSVLFAMQDALHSGLASWVRDDALLTTVMMSDERDCSLDLKPLAGADEISPRQLGIGEKLLSPMDLSEQCFAKGARCEGQGNDSYDHCEIRERANDKGSALLATHSVAQGLIALKGNREDRVMVTSISGLVNDEVSLKYPRPRSAEYRAPGIGCASWAPKSPALHPRTQVAQAPIRMRSLAEALTTSEERALFSICMEDLRRPLHRIAKQALQRMEPLCVFGPKLDRSSSTHRPSCELIANDAGSSTPIPECVRSAQGYLLDDAGLGLLRPVGQERCFAMKTEINEDSLDAMAPKCHQQGALMELELHSTPGTLPDPNLRWTLRCGQARSLPGA